MTSRGSSGRLDSLFASIESDLWRSLLVDLILVAAWIAVASVTFRIASWPVWLYYVVVFGGVIGYSLAIVGRRQRED